MNLPAGEFVPISDSWSEQNQRWLSQRFDFWRDQLDRLSELSSERTEPPPTLDDCAAHRIRGVFDLTDFEAELLLLAVGVEINLPLRDAVARAQRALYIEHMHIHNVPRAMKRG